MKEQIEAVKRMQDYINNHLFEKITLNDLSKVSLFSPWYSHRIFLQFT
ncbi:MAG: AraC family transcriptional regulator, partial [Clostridium sp.]|nr:AraC family transcriptional regulator [Clostridium sp.]